MAQKAKSATIASIAAIIFLFIVLRPGVFFNMIGYIIAYLIFGENTPEDIKYEKTVIISFDILCGLILFWIVYKVVNKIQKSKS